MTISARNSSLDILRVLACLGVISIHTAGSPVLFGMVEDGSLWWMECKIMDALVRWSVPVFVILTGYLMLNPERELNIDKRFGKRVLRLIVALIFWTIFYAVTLNWRFYPFGGQDSHFWYMGMCVGLYLSLPVLRLIAQSEKVLAYACWIWLFIRCYYFIGMFIDVPIEFTDYVFTDYVGYCLWGYYLSRLQLSKKTENGLYIVGVLSLVLTAVMMIYWNVGSAYESPNVILSSLAVFYFALKHPLPESKITKPITELSKVSLGIYLLHMFVLIEIFFRAHRFIPDPIILVPVCVLSVFVFSGIVCVLLGKIKHVGKWIV